MEAYSTACHIMETTPTGTNLFYFVDIMRKFYFLGYTVYSIGCIVNRNVTKLILDRFGCRKNRNIEEKLLLSQLFTFMHEFCLLVDISPPTPLCLLFRKDRKEREERFLAGTMAQIRGISSD